MLRTEQVQNIAEFNHLFNEYIGEFEEITSQSDTKHIMKRKFEELYSKISILKFDILREAYNLLPFDFEILSRAGRLSSEHQNILQEINNINKFFQDFDQIYNK